MSIGRRMFNNIKMEVQDGLNKYVNSNDDRIDGSKLQNDWFPTLDNIDIFISHSHNDEKLAIGLAGFLKSQFGLTLFVDSCVWGYANDLLKIIDDEYCLVNNNGTYDYEKRNYSTSHVHMMLSSALNSMIDKVECIMFLNTNNSNLGVNDSINNKTASPWIYSEIMATKIIRQKNLKEYRPNGIIKEGMYNEAKGLDLKIQYDISLDHFVEIDDDTLEKWMKIWVKCKGILEHPLDVLYNILNVS